MDVQNRHNIGVRFITYLDQNMDDCTTSVKEFII